MSRNDKKTPQNTAGQAQDRSAKQGAGNATQNAAGHALNAGHAQGQNVTEHATENAAGQATKNTAREPLLTLNFAAYSDRGHVRDNNEDSAYAGSRLLALADGMGGHAAGEVASQFLIDSLLTLDETPNAEQSLHTLLRTAMEEGNQAISSYVEENRHCEGMGCTLSALLFRDRQVGLCHVGDSRAYLLRDGELTQITKDDTFVQTLVDEGTLDPEEIYQHPQRSLILKALTGQDVDPHLETFEVKAGDRFMLCSDGLSDPVSADTIKDALSTATPEHSARRLVELALRSGGPDNVTVVIGDVVEVDPETRKPLDPAVKIPATPVLVGAVAGAVEDMRAGNTAASRAAALSLQTRSRRHNSAAQGADSRGVSQAAQSGEVEPGTHDSQGRGSASGGAEDSAQGDTAHDGTETTAQNGAAQNSTALGAAQNSTTQDTEQDKNHGSAGKNTQGNTQSKAQGTDNTARKAQDSDTHDPTTPPAKTLEGSRPRRRGGLLAVLVLLAILLAGGAGVVALKKSFRNTYYVAEHNGEILIYNGKKDFPFADTFNRPYQAVCLSSSNEVSLFTPESDSGATSGDSSQGSTTQDSTTQANTTQGNATAPATCHRFNVRDLTPVARGAISTLPEGSYDEAAEQVKRLAERTLPVCVERESATGAPEDLTTPGVSCRELKR